MKKFLLWGGGLLVVLVVVGVIAGPWVYKHWIAGEPDKALSLPSSTQAASVGLDGTWTIGAGPSEADTRTQAGYRVDETLRGQKITVNGRTTKVTGQSTVASGKLESATIDVDVASITSPESQRDNRFRGSSIMDTGRYPTATWKLDAPVDLSSVPESGAAVPIAVNGTMTIKGQARQISTTLNVQRSGSTLIAQGSVPVTWTDYGVTPPSLGFVEVQPTGTVEFLVNLTKS
ncbi:YceI family protein [Williamsia sterculiae]|uniref:Polyisoprenoid-binding protein YceI n=1 Tax=Williamsia sterculiae TaxID=1344003 RepID=A0A1N7EPB6_9NOCA|nr:YceI family protein [Williamsia sterculiae]SIR89904.1 Polyisoprenoid-binding protein YceI [Williamsia sterculiae]